MIAQVVILVDELLLLAVILAISLSIMHYNVNTSTYFCAIAISL